MLNWIVIGKYTEAPPDIDITFDYPTEGDMVDSITLPSSISWVQFQEEMCTVMALRIKDLKLSYKFSTHPQRETPRILSTPTAFLKMKDAASAQIHEQEMSTKKGKKGRSKGAFRVILIDSGKKTREKAASVKGKVFADVLSPFDVTDFIEHFRRRAWPLRDPHQKKMRNHLKRDLENTTVFSYQNVHAPFIRGCAFPYPIPITRPSPTVIWVYGQR